MQIIRHFKRICKIYAPSYYRKRSYLKAVLPSALYMTMPNSADSVSENLPFATLKLANGKQKGWVISNANAPTWGANLTKFKTAGFNEWNISNEISV